MSRRENIVADFDKNHSRYLQFTDKIEQLLKQLLLIEDIHYHSISGRVKERSSLEKKLRKGRGKYANLGDVTDLTGIRIITYFSGDVDAIARVIEGEFEVDWSNSIDKRAVIEEDRFGYLSLHYVVSLSSSRTQLIENKYLKGLKAEIQIRSILQHAWAEIEHDLGYKSQEKIPREIRRSFSRVAGLLETADLEFMHIRKRLGKLEEELILQMEKNPSSVQITKTSLRLAMEHVSGFQTMNKCFFGHESSSIDIENLDGYKTKLNYLSIQSIDVLLQLTNKYKDKICMLHKMMKEEGKHWLDYLALLFVLEFYSIEGVCEYFRYFSLTENESCDEEVKKLLVMNDIMNQEAGELM